MMSITESKLPKFKAWLQAAGCEILPNSNPYELLRFMSAIGIGVVYKGKKGISTSSPLVDEAYECYIKRRPWRGKGKPTRHPKTSQVERLRKQLFMRDGDKCFFCGEAIEWPAMTIEHLIPRNQGGPNKLSNMVMACSECNQAAGHMTIVQKVQLRDEIRAKSC